MPRQAGGGSVGQSLRYVDPQAPEQSASAGSNLLIERGLIARPAIGGTRKRKGGFYPSVMGGVVNSAMVAGPLAVFAARKMLSNRKGGSRKGNLWKAQKEEAKAILEGYGKPTAINIQKFAVAKRRGSAASEEYLENFRGRMVQKAELAAAKQAAKLAKKAEREEKKRARQAAKATKKAAKKSGEPTKKRERKPKAKGTHLFFNNEGRVINAKTRKATVKPVAPASRVKTRSSVSNKSRSYFEELKKARQYLSTLGRPTGPNMSRFASMKLKGVNTSSWEENFKTRRPLGTAKAAPREEVPREEAPREEAPRTNVVPKTQKNKAVNTAVKTRKAPSNKSKAYFEELKKAREYLSTVGRPTGPNMSKFASMKLKGVNTAAWVENFKTRRPLGTAKAPKKERETKKPLTVVKEENENNNNE
jgi:hypothetical protein